MIKNLKVVHEVYNADYERSTTFWPGQELSWRSEDKVKPYSLENALLPRGLELKFDAETPLYALIGPNECGKSTFLKTLARSLDNLHYFRENGRTALFDGALGFGADLQIVQGTGGLLTSVYAHSKESMLAYCTPSYAERQAPCNDKNKHSGRRFIQALPFYLPHDEVFDTPNFSPYNYMSEELVHARLTHLFGCYLDVEEEKNPIPLEVLAQLKLVSDQEDISVPDLERRLAYLIDHWETVPQIAFDVNVFG